MKNKLSDGYVVRPANLEDVEASVEMFNAVSQSMIGNDEFTVDEYSNEWQIPGFILETDTRLVIAPDGRVVGCYEIWDLNDPCLRLGTRGRTHPDYCGMGIGSHLLEWAIERASQAVLRAPEESRVVLHSHVRSINKAAGELLSDFGFRSIRHSWRMVIELNGKPPAPLWPEGISVRTFLAGQEETLVVQAVREAFKDHWGYIETPFEDDLERWMHFINNDKNFDPSLWYLAMDGEEIAGVSLCLPKHHDAPDMGWVETLGVRRPWRRRGVALALLHHSFNELHKRGTCKVGLGVDAQSLTGATRLYRKAGMLPDPKHQYELFEKELRPGVDLSTQSVSS
jgi:GNAT superfamily N-acetyltransferase